MDAMDSAAANKANRILVAHAVFGGLAALILAPGAILVGRYGRTWRHWALLHIVINSFTVVFVIVAYATGQAGSGANPSDREADSAHPALGAVVLVIVLVQLVGGGLAKWVRCPDYNYVTLQKKRHWIRYLHILLGITGLALLWAQVYTGFEYWDETSPKMTMVPRGIRIAFLVLLALSAALYVAGWPIQEYLGRKRRAREMKVIPETKEARDSTDPLVTGRY